MGLEVAESLPAGSGEDWLCWRALNRMRTGVGHAKSGKSRGTDNIPPELLKAGGKYIVKFYTQLCNEVVETGEQFNNNCLRGGNRTSNSLILWELWNGDQPR